MKLNSLEKGTFNLPLLYPNHHYIKIADMNGRDNQRVERDGTINKSGGWSTYLDISDIAGPK